MYNTLKYLATILFVIVGIFISHKIITSITDTDESNGGTHAFFYIPALVQEVYPQHNTEESVALVRWLDGDLTEEQLFFTPEIGDKIYVRCTRKKTDYNCNDFVAETYAPFYVIVPVDDYDSLFVKE